MDAFTLLAQVFNFLVLVVLLRRLLFRPLLRVMDERERRFVQRHQEAEAGIRQAEELLARARAEQEEFEKTRSLLRSQAEAEAAEQRRHLLEEARAEVASRREEWLRTEALEREATLRALRPRLASALGSLCRRALRDLADQDLEERMARRLAERLAGNPPLPSSAPVRIATSCPLGEAGRQALARALGTDRLEFVTREEALPGVRVRSGGWEVEWTLDSYLDRLEERILKVLEEKRDVPPSP